MWVAQGDDDLECLAVEGLVVAYHPQLGDDSDKKVWAGLILQMDHLGTDVMLMNKMSMENILFNFLKEGEIIRMRTRGVEQSILDVYVTFGKILPYITKMKVGENR